MRAVLIESWVDRFKLINYVLLIRGLYQSLTAISKAPIKFIHKQTLHRVTTNTMLEINNSTPFVADFAIFADQNGVDTLYTMVKGTFQFNGKLTLSEKQQPLFKADTYLGEPGNSSLKTASDYHLGKPATDVIILGYAQTLDESPLTSMDVVAEVGHLNKTLKVFGDRNWEGSIMTSPIPFTSMPLIYERAFGGDGESFMQNDHSPIDKNPAGVGYHANTVQNEQVLPLPNIEDPASLISDISDQPEPAGFGFIAPHWAPRRYYSGTYDEQWKRTRAPYLPEDFDPRFFNCASKELIADAYLSGGEPIYVAGMNHQGPWQALVPKVGLSCRVKIGSNITQLPFNLETLILEPNHNTLSVVWRASMPISKKVLQVDSIDISLAKSMGASP